jgi:hypothetical protein
VDDGEALRRADDVGQARHGDGGRRGSRASRRLQQLTPVELRERRDLRQVL